MVPASGGLPAIFEASSLTSPESLPDHGEALTSHRLACVSPSIPREIRVGVRREYITLESFSRILFGRLSFSAAGDSIKRKTTGPDLLLEGCGLLSTTQPPAEAG